MISGWRRWRELTWRDRITFLQGLLLLPLASLVLRLWRFQSVLFYLTDRTHLKDRQSEENPLHEARRIALMINASARRVPYDATCLRRSLVLWWLLRRRGIDSRLRIGARLQGDDFLAHAWVECQDCVVNDSATVQSDFITLL